MLSAAGCSTFTTEPLGDLFPSEVIISHKGTHKVIPTISGGRRTQSSERFKMKQQYIYIASIELVATLGFTRLGRIG